MAAGAGTFMTHPGGEENNSGAGAPSAEHTPSTAVATSFGVCLRRRTAKRGATIRFILSHHSRQVGARTLSPPLVVSEQIQDSAIIRDAVREVMRDLDFSDPRNIPDLEAMLANKDFTEGLDEALKKALPTSQASRGSKRSRAAYDSNMSEADQVSPVRQGRIKVLFDDEDDEVAAKLADVPAKVHPKIAPSLEGSVGASDARRTLVDILNYSVTGYKVGVSIRSATATRPAVARVVYQGVYDTRLKIRQVTTGDITDAEQVRAAIIAAAQTLNITFEAGFLLNPATTRTDCNRLMDCLRGKDFIDLVEHHLSAMVSSRVAAPVEHPVAATIFYPGHCASAGAPDAKAGSSDETATLTHAP